MEWYYFTIYGLIFSMIGSMVMQTQFRIGNAMCFLGIALTVIGLLKTLM